MENIRRVLAGLPHTHIDKCMEWFNSATQYPAYCFLAFILRPKRILEIGVRLGYSGIALCRGGLGSTESYFGIDAEFEEHYYGTVIPPLLNILEKAEENFSQTCREFGIKTEFLNINTQSMNDLEVLEGKTFDLIHIDADHSYSGAIHDIALFWECLEVGGLMFVDDTQAGMSVRSAVEDFIRERGTHWIEINTHRGGILIHKHQ